MKPWKLLPIVSLALLGAPAGRAEILDRVVVKVNGEIVTLSEFEARQVSALQQARIGPERVEAFLRDNNARILQDAIDELLFVQRADELGVKMRPDYLNEVVEGIKKENNIASDDALREQLRREGLTLDDMKRNLARSILRQRVVQQEIDAKLLVTEAEVRADYEARLAEFTRPARVKLQEILIPLEREGADAEAGELLARLRAGEDFAALARERSAAPSRNAGGDLGELDAHELHPEVARAAAGLKPGEVTEPLASPDGYRILRLVERSEAGTTPFESVRADVRRRLLERRRAAEYEQYVKQLRDKAIIDVRVREVPLQVTVPATSILDVPELETARPAAPGHRQPAGADAPEFETTPQAVPERVSPAPAAEAKPEEEKPPR